ncbi:MAG: hypothetical protein GY711_09770 [bacterium]|nr:hypothetical protein [bacterium]
MRRPYIPLALCAAAAIAVAQERVKPKSAADFPKTIEAASKAWTAGHYGRCLDNLRTAIGLVSNKRAEAIRAALPGAPAGFEVVPERKTDATANPYLSGVTAMVGSNVTRKYRETDGRASMNVSVTSDSPMIGMFSTYAANPALLGPDAELIKYGSHTAVLRKEGGGKQHTLQLLIEGKHMCETKLRGRDDEFLLKVWNQAAVDKLAAALMN